MTFDPIICTYLVGVVCVALVGGLIVGDRAEPAIVAMLWPIFAFVFVLVVPVAVAVSLGAFIRRRFKSEEELEGGQ